MWVRWKIGILVVLVPDEVEVYFDALEVLPEKATYAGMTTKSAAKNASG